MPQRKWATLSLNQELEVSPHQFNPERHYISSMVVEVDFFNKKNFTTEAYNSDEMAREFSMQFPNQAFTVGQQCVFSFKDKKLLLFVVKQCDATDLRAIRAGQVNSFSMRYRRLAYIWHVSWEVGSR